MGDDAIEGGLYIGFDITVLRRKKQQALLGYMSIDLLDPPAGAEWGHFNDRLVEPSWVRVLVDHYEKMVDNCTDATVIDAAVKKAWVANLSDIKSSVEGEHIEDVPVMSFTEAGEKEMVPKNFWILGGNHRRIALRSWVDAKRKEVAIHQALSEKLKKEEEHGYDYSRDRAIREADRAASDLEEKIRKSQKWVLRLYDRGDC